eukprot:COSAG01_NODE_62799_length_282_cov_195.672131_1_plen_61_part_10
MEAEAEAAAAREARRAAEREAEVRELPVSARFCPFLHFCLASQSGVGRRLAVGSDTNTHTH